jgi:hypothetical protein
MENSFRNVSGSAPEHERSQNRGFPATRNPPTYAFQLTSGKRESNAKNFVYLIRERDKNILQKKY